MTKKSTNQELNETELDDVQGGVALLLPAVSAAREAARNDSSAQSSTPTESLSLNYEKIKFEY